MQRLAIKPSFAKAAKSDRNSVQKGKEKKKKSKAKHNETKQKEEREREREGREERAKSKAAARGWWGISPKKEPWELPSFEGQHFQEPR